MKVLGFMELLDECFIPSSPGTILELNSCVKCLMPCVAGYHLPNRMLRILGTIYS